MNFFRDFLRSSQSQKTDPPPGYPAPAYPSSSSRSQPPKKDEDQWDVDAVEKSVAVVSSGRSGVADMSLTEHQRRETEVLESARGANLACRQRQEERRLKEEQEATNRVELAMYDLSGGLVQYVPAALLSGAKFDGIWHTGCRVFGKEYWFGGGVFETAFGESPFGSPVRLERLGTTDRTHEELLEFIRDEVMGAYNTKTYHFLSRNCNHFSNEIVRFLLVGRHAKGPLEEVLAQPDWCYNHTLAQMIIPALNNWLGGFGADDPFVVGKVPQVRHMTRAEKEQEQKRVAAQWAEWVQEKNRQWEKQMEERRREDEEDKFQDWMLGQHQKMEDEEKAAKLRAERELEKRRQARQLEELIKAQEKYDAEEQQQKQQRESEERRAREQQHRGTEEQKQHTQQSTQRQKEVEQTLRDILKATKEGADAAVLEWALAEAKEAGLASTAPFLIRDAEYVIRERR